MPISRRLTITFLSILLLTLIAGGLTQLVHAQDPVKVTVQANIVWVNGPKPPIRLQLFHKLENGPEEPVYDDAFRDPDTNGIYEWKDVQTHDGKGNQFTFIVKQLYGDVITNKYIAGDPPNYKVTTETVGPYKYTITNTYVVPKNASATAMKEWVGGPTVKPTIWFKLFRTSDTIPTQEVSGAEVKVLISGTNTVTWTGLEATDLTGNPYHFSVLEGTWNASTNTFIEGGPQYFIPKYSLDGLTVTNTFTPSVTASKVWVNGPISRPTIWLKLFRQIETGSVIEVPGADLKELISGKNTVTWDNQFVQYADGKYYNFSVKEVNEFGESFQPVNYIKLEDGLTVTNNYIVPMQGQFRATKKWVNGSQPRPTIAFELYRYTTDPKKAVMVPVDRIVLLDGGPTDAEWSGLEQTDINGIPYRYLVNELHFNATLNRFIDGPPTNYELDYVYSADFLSALVTNTYNSSLIDIIATKKWIGGTNPRPIIAFRLYRGTDATTRKPLDDSFIKELKSGTEVVVWTGLAKFDPNNTPYNYSVVEGTWNDDKTVFTEGPPPMYQVEYSTDTNGLSVTNTYSTQLTVTATKVWEGGPTTKPTIWFKLYRQVEGGTAEPVPAAEAEIKALPNDTTTVSWQIENDKDQTNKPYTFTVREGEWDATTSTFTEGAPQYFVATYSTDGLTVTNTFTPIVTATKVWTGGPAVKPAIWFKLYRQIEGGTSEPVPTTEAAIKPLPNGTTSVTWDKLTIQNQDGKYYTFSVQEVNDQGQPFTPANFRKIENGLTVTNVATTSSPTFTKVWVYGPTAKPSVWFKLYRKTTTGIDQEVPVEEAPVTAIPTTAPLTVTWTNLSATDINGTPYSFYIKEGTYNATSKVFTEGLTNYTKAVSTDGLTITNTYVSPKINVIGYKVWSGGPAAKPNIQLQLYRNGSAYGSPYTLTGNLTSYTWANMDQTDLNGAIYQYTIDEVSVPAYHSKRVNGMTVTNTYTGTIPYTGDNTHNAQWLLLLLGLSALLPLAHWLDLKLLTRR